MVVIRKVILLSMYLAMIGVGLWAVMSHPKRPHDPNQLAT
jgi:hypothetical protein